MEILLWTTFVFKLHLCPGSLTCCPILQTLDLASLHNYVSKFLEAILSPFIHTPFLWLCWSWDPWLLWCGKTAWTRTQECLLLLENKAQSVWNSWGSESLGDWIWYSNRHCMSLYEFNTPSKVGRASSLNCGDHSSPYYEVASQCSHQPGLRFFALIPSWPAVWPLFPVNSCYSTLEHALPLIFK
jgi:hypothetical protein